MKLQELIEKKHWTRETAARRLGIAERTLYYWLEGKYNPDLVQLKKICEILECSSSDILGY